MKRPWTSYTLIVLTTFQVLSALPAGLILMLDSSGMNLGLSPETIDTSPFGSYFIPGLFLFFILGGFPIIILIGLIKKPEFGIFTRLSLYKDCHWSWSFSYYLGILLILWINMELLFIKEYSFLQVVYSILGVLIIILTHLPITRRFYNISNGPTQ